MRITKIEVRAVAPPVDRFTWSDDLPDQFATNTILRVHTDAGIDGVAGVWNATSYGFERYTAEAIRHIAPVLIGKDPLLREQMWHAIRPRVFPLPPQALAAVDVSLWDLAGKVAGLPLYKLLGGARETMPAYASTPMFDDVDAYLHKIDEFIQQGFKAVKFHTWCIPERDLELAYAVRERYSGDDVAFMLDAENNYDRESALRVARALSDLGFEWFEAPLHDSDLEGYRELTRRVSIPVIPSGNWIQDLPAFAEAVRSKAWGRARTDVAAMGGITQTSKALAVTRAAGVKCEIMSWGYSLVAAANLHLMLAYGNCSYFEQAVPFDAYEYGMRDAIRPNSDGDVRAPDKPGLGLDVDWDAMEAATLHSFVVE